MRAHPNDPENPANPGFLPDWHDNPGFTMREHGIETLKTLSSAILAPVLSRLSAKGYALNVSLVTRLAIKSRWT